MIHQQGMKAPVWGKDKPGQKVKVSISGKSVSAKAGKNGKWKVALPVLKAGGAYEMMITGSESVTIRDVLVGEVWLASGQSNMELALSNSKNADSEIPQAHYPQIRLFIQYRFFSYKPQVTQKRSSKYCTSDSINDFSDMVHSFAKNHH